MEPDAAPPGVQMEVEMMHPDSIRFTQSTISKYFSRGKQQSNSSYSEAVKASGQQAGLGGRAVHDMLDQLRRGELSVTDVPPIRVYVHRGVTYSLDNRRLWVFKNFGQAIPVTVVGARDCEKEFMRKLDSKASGDLASVRFYDGADGKDKFHEVSMLQQVLSWSLENVQQKRLYANKGKRIGQTFHSQAQYLRGFRWPVLEEVRATIQQQLGSIEVAPRLQVTARERDYRIDDGPQIRVFELQCSRGTYQPRTKDLILLATIDPECLDDLHKALYTFGFVRQVTDSGGPDNLFLTALVYGPDLSREYYALQNDETTWTVLHMTNLSTKLRIWDTLEHLHSSGVQVPILQEIVQAEFEYPTLSDQGSCFDRVELAVREYCAHNRAMNSAQVEAVIDAVFGLVKRERPLVRLIQGPPGTGKTSLLLSLLSILGSMNYRVHMAAPTNTAICEVASRFVSGQILVEPQQNCVQFGAYFPGLTIGGNDSEILNLGDVVLIGSEEGVDLMANEVLEVIYLPRRVSRLMEALSLRTGYKKSAEDLKHFLKYALEDYKRYTLCLETANISEKPKSLATYVRESLKDLSHSIVTTAHSMCQDVPSSLLSPKARGTIYQVSLLIKQIMEYLNSQDLSDGEVRLWLSNASAERSPPQSGRMVGVSSFEDLVRLKVNVLQTLEACPDCDVLEGKVPSKGSLESICLSQVRILFSTVATGGRQCVARSRPFNCVVIDEAAQLVEAETLVVLHSPGIQQVILVGDHKQLEATVLSEVAKDWQYGRSLFKRLYMLDYPCRMLDVQYRMHPNISVFPNHQFYDGRVKNGSNVLSDGYSSLHSTTLKPYMFLSITDGTEQRDIGEQSYINLVEVGVVMHLIDMLNKVCAEKAICCSVGVIAPYRGQVEELARRLDSIEKNFPNIKAEVQSVDGFQGREKDVIIFSAVRSNSKGVIGFLSAHERLNVAITRARYCLWIVGNGDTLSSDSVWRSLIEDCKHRKCFAQPDESMVRVIMKVKSYMNRLEDLLSPTSCLLNNTLWKVLSSSELVKTVRKLKSKYARQLVLEAVLKLAEGRHGTNWTYRRDLSGGPHLKIAQVYRVGRLYLVWSVDVQFAPEVKQVLKFWDAVEFGNIPTLLARLDAAFATYTDAYVGRCTIRRGDSKNCVSPIKWEHDGGFVRFKTLEQSPMQASGSMEESVLEKACVDESMLLMKFYALDSGIAHQLITAADGSNFELPFEVNDDESRIVRYEKSSFILGRSGTGKTTVITTKLLQRQQKFRLANNGFGEIAEKNERGPENKDGFLRQVLLTRSPKLCAAIKHHINRVQRCLEAAGSGATIENIAETEGKLQEDDEDNLLGSIPNRFRDIPANSFPLVITFSKLLNMIEGSLANPFFSPEERACRESSNTVAAALLNAKQAEHPKRENGQIPAGSREEGSEIRKGHTRLLSDNKTPRVEVDFSRFRDVYWSQFNNELTRGFSASLVYTEIMSSIKGSLAALKSPGKFMERTDYITLAHQRSSIFAEEERETIYKLYLKYEKVKTITYNDYDVADFVMHLHSELEERGLNGQSLHYVYVDEVQDLTQAEVALLRYICHDHENGFMFAGDTAQTIAKGVGFRFQDIRKLFYVEFVHRNMSGVEDALQSEDFTKSTSKAVPDMHYLTQNFRTHSGILKLANSVVQQIYHFFPHAIDRLQPETSLLQGDVPLFLTIDGNHDLVTSLFDRGDMAGGGCEFGAEQAILVRNENRKQATLRSLEAMHKRCLVLTVEECKGLEFQDVLLYNFFADSQLDRKWRVLYDILQHGNCLRAGEKKPIAYSKFQPQKHNILCSELKQLYVAVTRARQRLLIYDEDGDSHRPMLDYWTAGNLVQVQVLDEPLVEKLKRKSSAQDWKRTGIKLFDAKQFSDAKHFFQKAGNFEYAKIAEAEEYMQEAGKQGANVQKITACLRAACDIYLVVQKLDKAVMCCKLLEDYKQGGAILEKNQRFEEAGDFYRGGRHFFEAANAYHKGRCVKKCLDICWQAKFFDADLSFIREWEQGSHHGNSQGPYGSHEYDVIAYLQRCADHFKKQNKVPDMMKYVKMFPSMDLQRHFLQDNLNELLELEEAAGNFREAEKIAEEIGAWERSATLSLKAGDPQGAIDKLLRLLQLELFWGGGNGKEHELIRTMEQQLDQTEASHASKLELRILRTVRDPDADIGLLLDTWNEARLLQAPRLEIIAGKIVLSHILNVMLGNPGFLTAKARDQWHLPALDGYEAALEGAELRVLCKKLWVIWSGCIKCVLERLKSFADCKVSTRVDDPHLNACFDLLGVRQLAAGSFYLQYRKARWLKGQHPSRQDITKNEFTTLALEYWREEVLEVSNNILRNMDNPYRRIAERGDKELQLAMLIEMVEMGQMLESMNVRKNSQRHRWCPNREVLSLLSDYAGYRAPESRDIVPVLDSMAKEACQANKVALATVLTLYPYISRQCIDDMIEGAAMATHDVVKHILKSWRLSCSIDVEPPPILCSTLASVLEKSKICTVHKSVTLPGDYSICLCAERATVAVCAVYTHLDGLVIPLRLAYSYMSGANQEPFYSEAALAECASRGHECVVPVFQQIAEHILSLLQERQEPDLYVDLLVALVMLLINVKNHGDILQSLHTLFMQSYKKWKLPKRFQEEFFSVFRNRRRPVTDGQLGAAFVRATQAIEVPLIVITTKERVLPYWVREGEVPRVLLQNDSSGKPRFSLNNTDFDWGPSKHVSLLHGDVSWSLEKGNLESLVEILSRKEPPEPTVPPVEEAAIGLASDDNGIVGMEREQSHEIEGEAVVTSEGNQQGCQGPLSQHSNRKKGNNRKNRNVAKELQASPPTSQQQSSNQGKNNKNNRKKAKNRKQ